MSDQNKADRVVLAKDGRVLPVAELKVPMPKVAAPAPSTPTPKAKPGN